jgi:hypothetical protein
MIELNDITKHKWSDDMITRVFCGIDIFKDGNNVKAIGLEIDNNDVLTLNKNDIKVAANYFNQFNNYVSVDKIKAVIDKIANSGRVNSDYFVATLEQLIKPKDKQ